MVYALHALKVVAGAVLTLMMYGLITQTTYLDEALILGAGFVLGLFLVIHGLFTGIEAAVAAGNAPPPESQSAE